MSKQDGIGTWVWNENVEIDGTQTYTFNFSSGGTDYSSISFDGSFPPPLYYIDYGSDNVYFNMWFGGYKTINIKTAPPAEFLTILQANATYQEAKVTDLTGTTWKWNETIDTPFSLDSAHADIYFISNGQQFIDLISNVNNDTNNGCDIIYEGYDTDYYSVLAYMSASDSVILEVFPEAVIGWQNQSLRTISITGGTDATNTDLINYLYANATLQGSEPSPSGTTITYNGKTIATLSDGQTATMACAGKKAVSDIVVAFVAAGTVTYNGKETAVAAGKTATLSCAGKKMVTDVAVKVGGSEPAGDELLGTWYFNETLDETSIDADIGFSCDGRSYVFITYDAFLLCTLAYKTPEGEPPAPGYVPEPSVTVTAYSEGVWEAKTYRTITITDTSTLTNRAEFTAWLKANATKQ